VKKALCALMLLLFSFPVFSQTRADTLVYVLDILGGTAEEQAFFLENLKIEIPAAGYTITENILEADYALSCSIVEDDTGHSLLLSLVNAKEEREIVSTDLAYTEKEETYEMLPFVLWSMFSGAPLKQVVTEIEYVEVEKEVPVYIEVIREVEKKKPEPTDEWKNRWLFVNAKLGVSPRFYLSAAPGQPDAMNFTFEGGIEPEISIPFLFDSIAVQLGINFALDRMEYQRSPINPMMISYSTYILSIPILVKYVFNPGSLTSLGSYLGAYFPIPLLGVSTPPFLGLIAGLDFNYKTAGPGALVFDLRYSMDLGSSSVSDGSISYNRIFVTLSVGYKLGFISR
jgi:hypothetical protein